MNRRIGLAATVPACGVAAPAASGQEMSTVDETAARSVHPVDMTRPVVELTNFLSPDGGIWCGIFDDYSFCGRDVNRSGRVHEDGTVDLCDQSTYGCVQNWDFAAPRLAEGQNSAPDGFSCAAQAGRVTCTLTEGEHAGKGFRIDAASMAAVP